MIRPVQVGVSGPEQEPSLCTPDPCLIVGSTSLSTEDWLCRFSCRRVMKETPFEGNIIFECHPEEKGSELRLLLQVGVTSHSC